MKFTPPEGIQAVLQPFTPLFTRPTWERAQVLLCGMLLSSTATITSALRMLGLAEEPHFCNFHRLFNRASWSALAVARVLLTLLVKVFAPGNSPLIFGLDDTLERRRGMKITARAIYRDSNISSKGCPQKSSAIRWMSLQLLAPVPWAKRTWGLPFLTAICPSARYTPYMDKGRKHKPLHVRARGLIGWIVRCLAPLGRKLLFVADNAYSAIELLQWCTRMSKRLGGRGPVLVTRLRMDANLFEPAPTRVNHQNGRPRVKGKKLPKLSKVLKYKRTKWEKLKLAWYGSPGFAERLVEVASGTCIWYNGQKGSVPIRWVLVRDPLGQFEAQAFLSTDLSLTPQAIMEAFVRRWQMEVTFQEANEHLGLPGQRQWKDEAIERTTPARLGLFSFVCLVVEQLLKNGEPLPVNRAAWYPKCVPTFSDALAWVRQLIWRQMGFLMSQSEPDVEKPTANLFEHLVERLCHAA